MLIKYKGNFHTLRDVCALLRIDYDDFMAWCKRLTSQKYEYALNYYKRQLRNKK